MGVLLMQYEYQMAKAKSTLYERKATLLNNQKQRYTKRIELVNKAFAKKESNNTSYWTSASTRIGSALATGRVNQTALESAVGIIGGIIGFDKLAGYDVASELSAIEGDDNNSKLAQVANQLQTYVTQMIDSIKTAEEEELEYTKEAQLAPLNEKDAELDIEIASNEALQTMADTRAENAKSRLQTVTKDSMAHYGLG